MEVEGVRNSDDVARALFFGPFAANGSFTVKVGMISIALVVFLAMGLNGICSFIIEVVSLEGFVWFEVCFTDWCYLGV
ncbi:hypothetical protein J1N35_017898 [Gossypium stocksii]|uniref:Uncharacterized protein n=1 Tax=Gossypium stocksii TaxID=47602 RepID=A0A9D4A6N3_9ROSI|nr:hypothetical protein J1N35_017898 [Gossypium stocksii]